MKYNKRRVFIFSITLIFIISFFAGHLIGNKKLNDKLEKHEGSKFEDSDMNVKISKEIDKITPNTIIEERTFYNECGHLIIKTDLADSEIVNKSEDDYKDYLSENFPNLRIISFSNSKITLWTEENYLCENHHIIGEMDGYIAIFNINEDGERILDVVFKEYPISLLMDIDREKLYEGIIVDSKEELSEVLENFI